MPKSPALTTPTKIRELRASCRRLFGEVLRRPRAAGTLRCRSPLPRTQRGDQRSTNHRHLKAIRNAVSDYSTGIVGVVGAKARAGHRIWL